MANAYTCFKAYDIRGRLGTELDALRARTIGRAFAQVLTARSVVVGRDIRASSLELAEAVILGLQDEGVRVLDLGLCGTEEMYWAVTEFGADGGIEVTASHNPITYNGMKLVGRGSAPLAGAIGLDRVRARAEAGNFGAAVSGGSRQDISVVARAAYVARVLSLVDLPSMRPLSIVVNSGNGAAGPTFDAIAVELTRRDVPLTFHRLHHAPDGSFPNGIPNPLLPENRPVTAQAVRQVGADIGIAFDGDFDRCFFFDETGAFVDGEYLVALLAQVFVARDPGAAIVHDPRVIWATRETVSRAGGRAIQTRTGHAFLKQALRDHDAAYGGEMSAHHYFRDFACCDSGMIPWLLVAELMGRTGQSLSALVADLRREFPSSGEINFTLRDPAAALARIEAEYAPRADDVDRMDGLGFDFGTWRFNLRASNTEPLVRLNIEARGDGALVAEKLAEISERLLNP